MKQEHTFSRRRFLSGTSALGIVCVTSGCAVSNTLAGGVGSSRWPFAPAPQPARIADTITQLGRTRTDWYSWMKFIPDEGQREMATLPPRVRQHLEEERAYAEAMLAPLEPAAAELAAAMLDRTGELTVVPPLHATGWAYFADEAQEGQFPVYRRRTPDGVVETLVDENVRAQGVPYYRTTDHQPSPDDNYFAWAEDIIGNDRHRILLRDNRNGEIRTAVEADAYGYGGLVFSPSSRWVYWIWRDAQNRPRRVYRSPVDGDEAVVIYEEADPAIFMQIARTSEGGFVAITLSGPDTSEVRIISAEDELAAPVIVRPRQPDVRYELDQWRGDIILLTDADAAYDGKVVRFVGSEHEQSETLVPHRVGRQILAIHPFRDGLVRLERENGAQRLVILSPQGEERVIDFGTEPAALELPMGQEYESPVFRVVFQSPKQPRRWYDIDLRTGARRLVAEERLSGFDPDEYEVERLFAPAPDGEMVPVTLLSRRGAARDGTTPLLLYGYGAYGISSEPEFSVPVSVLVDQGWRYAIAHVRGGSEKGRQWFLDGRKFSKRNSFTDFIACAEFLQRENYCDEDKIVAYGLSAGGLLVGASMAIRPDLWAGVIAKVPFVDMLNTMSDASHPLVPLFRPDWGDPLADPEAYDYIASISPYENAAPVAYPPLLCTAGLKDDRVGYWESAKFVAQVRYASTSGNPAILHLDENSGHQGSGSDAAAFAEYGLFWSFAERCVNEHESVG